MNLNFFIAKRIGADKGKGKISIASNTIAIISVAISIFIMILAVAISNGFKKEIRDKAVGYCGDMHISSPGVEITSDEYPITPPSYIDSVKNLDFIKNVSPVIYNYGLLKTEQQIQGVIFKGIDSSYNWDFFKKHLYKGKLPDFAIGNLQGDSNNISNEILISKRMSEIMNYDVSDKVTAYFIGENVKVRRFTISGLYDAQLEDLDKTIVIADSKQLIRLNEWTNGEISGYEIFLKNSVGKNFDNYANAISEIIDNNSSDEENPTILSTVKDSFTMLFDWLHLLDTNVLIIIVLMITVAGFNMISGILIIIFERISMIGTLKAIGMKTLNISKIFLYRASFIVLKGMLYGNIFAAIFCFVEWKYKIISLNPDNYFVSSVPISITVWQLLLLNIIAFVAIMIILTIPCHFISKISPAKTLKFE